MSAKTSRTAATPKNVPEILTEEQLADAAERQSAVTVLRKVAPYLWPADMPWVKKRVVWAMVTLIVAKLITVGTPVLYKGAVDTLSGEGVPMLALGAKPDHRTGCQRRRLPVALSALFDRAAYS